MGKKRYSAVVGSRVAGSAIAAADPHHTCRFSSDLWVTAMFQREWPSIGRRRVHRLMRSAGLQGRMWHRRLKTTQAGTDGVAASDLVGRCFERDRLDEVWVADSTYIQVKEGFGYLALVMDLCSNRIVGRSFSRSHDAELMRTALRQNESVGNASE